MGRGPAGRDSDKVVYCMVNPYLSSIVTVVVVVVVAIAGRG